MRIVLYHKIASKIEENFFQMVDVETTDNY